MIADSSAVRSMSGPSSDLKSLSLMKVYLLNAPNSVVGNSLDRESRIRFTKHAIEKFNTLKQYGFEVDERQVIETVLKPEQLDEKDGQFIATKVNKPKACFKGCL